MRAKFIHFNLSIKYANENVDVVKHTHTPALTQTRGFAIDCLIYIKQYLLFNRAGRALGSIDSGPNPHAPEETLCGGGSKSTSSSSLSNCVP